MRNIEFWKTSQDTKHEKSAEVESEESERSLRVEDMQQLMNEVGCVKRWLIFDVALLIINRRSNIMIFAFARMKLPSKFFEVEKFKKVVFRRRIRVDPRANISYR